MLVNDRLVAFASTGGASSLATYAGILLQIGNFLALKLLLVDKCGTTRLAVSLSRAAQLAQTVMTTAMVIADSVMHITWTCLRGWDSLTLGRLQSRGLVLVLDRQQCVMLVIAPHRRDHHLAIGRFIGQKLP